MNPYITSVGINLIHKASPILTTEGKGGWGFVWFFFVFFFAWLFVFIIWHFIGKCLLGLRSDRK